MRFEGVGNATMRDHRSVWGPNEPPDPAPASPRHPTRGQNEGFSFFDLVFKTSPHTAVMPRACVAHAGHPVRHGLPASLRAKRSNPSRHVRNAWIASSQVLLAMTVYPDTPSRTRGALRPSFARNLSPF